MRHHDDEPPPELYDDSTPETPEAPGPRHTITERTLRAMDDLTPATIAKIEQLAVAANGAAGKAALLKLPNEPEHVYGLIRHDGTFERVAAEPAPRDHAFASLAALISFVEEKGGPETVIWHDDENVIAILDDTTRRDRATLHLKQTPTMLRLHELDQDAELFDQRAFRRLLRVELAHSRKDNALLNWVSDLVFSSQAETRGTVGHGRDSMGKDIDAAANSKLGACPEELILDVRVFDDPSLTTRRIIKCAVEILPAEQRFRLTPYPGELDNAIAMEVAQIGDMIRSDLADPKVFAGAP